MTPAIVHLDTSFLVRALAAGTAEAQRLAEWIDDAVPMGISAIAWAEFLCGPVDDEVRALAATVLGEAVPLWGEDAVLAARLFNSSGRRRGTLSDCLVAAIAIRSSAALATCNRADVRRLEAAGLVIADF